LAATQARGNVRPRARASFDKSFCKKLVVGQQDYRPREIQLRRELARRRQRVTRAERAHKDSAPQPEINLPGKWPFFLRKWYHKFHKKWTFENTTTWCMLRIMLRVPDYLTFGHEKYQ
jgi:hypothetical protein